MAVFFGNCTIVEDFRIFETMHCDKERLKIAVNTSANLVALFLKTIPCISPEPGAFLVLTPWNVLVIRDL